MWRDHNGTSRYRKCIELRTGECTVQTFMDVGRSHGHETIGAAMEAFVVELTGARRKWARLNAEELEHIRNMLMS